MPINPLNHHYAMENPASVYDEEAMTALELAGRTTAKVNECVDEVNKIPSTVSKSVKDHIKSGDFDKQIDEHTAEVRDEIREQGELFELTVHGFEQTVADQETLFEGQVRATTAELTGRMDAFTTLGAGSTTGDAELVDARTGSDGTVHPNLGTAVRKQTLRSPLGVMTYNFYLNIDTVNRTATWDVNEANRITLSEFRRDKTLSLPGPIPTPKTIDFTSIGNLVFLWLNVNNPSGECPFFATLNRNNYTPTANDILLAAIHDDNVFPAYLSPWNIKVNGKPLVEWPSEYRLKPYSSHVVLVRGKLLVDGSKRTVSLPKDTFIQYPYHHRIKRGVGLIAETQTIQCPMDGSINYIVIDVVTDAMTLHDRYYEVKENELILGCVFNGAFFPMEVSSECVSYTNKPVDAGGFTTMTDFFAGLNSATAEKPFKIVLGGDSITHGVGGSGFIQDGELVLDTGSRQWYRNTEGYCWAKLFKEYMENNYHCEVVNNACTGTDSGTWNSYKTTLIPADADLLILTIGTNDRAGGGDRDGCVNRYYKNLREIVEYAHSIGVQVILTTCIPASATNEGGDVYNADVFQLNTVVQRVCGEFDQECANLYNEVFYHFMDNGLNYDTYLPDGLHPNDELYRIMFYKYLRVLGLPPHYQIIR